MAPAYESRSFRTQGLPPWRTWISRVAGMACFAAAVMSGIAIWREPSGVGVAVFGVCVIAGSLLVVLPDYFRYYVTLRECPPLPDRIEEAFDQTYANLREMRESLERMGKALETRDQERRQETVDTPVAGAEAWREEIEEAVTRLRLDCDAMEDRLRPVLPDEGQSASKPLPAGMLARALSGSGKGKGFPLSGESGAKE